MAIELVTGHTGYAHVTSSQMGALLMGIFGTGACILPTANRCKATLTTATTVSIDTGDIVADGRHIHLASPESVTIRNGVQNRQRTDLICIKYEMNVHDGTESARLEVITGTTGTLADPQVPTGSIKDGSSVAYYPIYRVSLDGISVSEPKATIEVVPNMMGMLFNGVSRWSKDFGVGRDGYHTMLYIEAHGHLVSYRWRWAYWTFQGQEQKKICIIPERYRPTEELRINLPTTWGQAIVMTVRENGSLELFNPSNKQVNAYFDTTGTWFTNQIPKIGA